MTDPVKQVALFITDSVGLPRHKGPEQVGLHETYVHLIKGQRPALEIIHVGIPAGPITELVRIAAYYRAAAPKYVVLQVGIVDCAPRALGPLELEIIKRLRVFRLVNPIRKQLRKHRNICYTSPKTFANALLQLKQVFSDSELISVGILPGCEDYELRVPGITNRIGEFNSILEEHTIYINNESFPREGISADHHHLNAQGNRLMAERILEYLD